ncbi:transcriptional regulator [Vibrio ponticus]|uniref:Transcriptional regulator n=1 Tax=Vibrio ponticus TaxID=265668 RepID=A0ABX3F3W2_9VIBR|nr:AraC family transcriptional regulator [Vibrio ponticus]OLQ84484.1 transcriptional regulator [Vibrio ponticus]
MKAWKKPLPGYEWLIHQVWYLEVEEGEVIEPKPYLIPNMRAHLLFTPETQAYSYDNGELILSGWGNHLLTATDKLLLLDDHPPLKRIGITFRPEALYCLNQEAVQPINQCQWFDWLTSLFDKQFQRVLWQSSDDATQLLNTVKQHFDSLSISPNQDKAFLLAQRAVTLIEHHIESPDRVDVAWLANECACSRRTLERSFKLVVGLSVKQYLQMMRLELMVLSIYQQQSDIDWTELSQQFGFSDQSHLIRTLKQQLGKTPTKYLKQRDLTIDIYGDFE